MARRLAVLPLAVTLTAASRLSETVGLLQTNSMHMSMETSGSDLAGMEQSLLAMGKQEGAIDPSVKGVLRTMRVNLTSIHIKSINDTAVASQARVNAEIGIFTNCTQDHAAGITANENKFLGDDGELTVTRTSHSTCRTDLQDLHDRQVLACDALTNFIGSVTAPDCSVPSRGGNANYFQSLKNFVANHESDWAAKESNCSKLEGEETNKASDCGTAQHAFEEKFCDYRAELHQKCTEYSQCYADAVVTFQATVNNEKEDEATNILDYTLVSRVDCYLVVLIDDNDTTTRSAAMDACGNLEPNTDHLVINVPSIPNQDRCDYSDVKHHPCTSSFMAQEYAGMNFLETCQACDELPEPAHPIIPLTFAHDMIGNQENGCFIFAAGHWHVVYANAANDQLVCDSQTNSYGQCTIGNIPLADVKQVTAGSDATYILMNDNQIFTYGRNDRYSGRGIASFGGSDKQLITDLLSGGYGACIRYEDLSMHCNGWDEMAPQIAATFTGKEMKHWSAGRFHACAIMLDDTVLCSPSPSAYSAGTGSMAIPEDIANNEGGQVEQLCTGMSYSCAIRKGDRKVVCWGTYDGNNEISGAPSKLGAVHLTCAYHQSCAGYDDGTLQCWGHAGHGATTVPAAVVENSDARFIGSSGDEIFLCAAVPNADGDGEAVCWGHWAGNMHQTFDHFGVIGRSAAQCGSMGFNYDG